MVAWLTALEGYSPVSWQRQVQRVKQNWSDQKRVVGNIVLKE